MRQRAFLNLSLAIVATFGAGTASAQNACSNPSVGVTSKVPSILVCAKGSPFSTPAVVVDGKLGLLRNTTIDLGNGGSFFIGASFDADPFVNFTFGSILPGTFGAVSFDVYFSTPVVGGPYNYAASQFASSIALSNPAGASGSSVSITPGSYPYYLSGFADATNLGVDAGSAACTLNTVSTLTCPPGGATSMFAPISPTLLTAHLSYTHLTTGPGTGTASWTGGVELTSVTTTVPEPSSIMLFAMGVVMIGATRARRNRAV